MIGVVLWCDEADRKAVIWCDDNGDLAFYHEKNDCLDPAEFFDAGDMVQFDIDMYRNLRQAKNARLVQEHAFVGLPERLKTTAAAPMPQHSAKVLKFTPMTSSKEPAFARLKA